MPNLNVSKEIKKLEKEKIVKDLTSEATPWFSQLVTVPKSNKDILLCKDMWNATAAIEKRHFSTFTVDDLLF